MTEYIEREALGVGKCNPDVFEDKGYAKGWNAAIEIIQNAPAADVRPVVFCRDCKSTKRGGRVMDDFTSCAVCQYNNGDKCELFGRVIGMHGCSSGVERKPRNHFERLKAMSMEEMAEYLEETVTRNPQCNLEKHCTNDDSCIPCWLEWLKEEVHDS